MARSGFGERATEPVAGEVDELRKGRHGMHRTKSSLVTARMAMSAKFTAMTAPWTSVLCSFHSAMPGLSCLSTHAALICSVARRDRRGRRPVRSVPLTSIART